MSVKAFQKPEITNNLETVLFSLITANKSLY